MSQLLGRIRGSVASRTRTALGRNLPRVPNRLRAHLVPLLRWVDGFQISAAAVEAARARLGAGGTLLVFSVGLDTPTWELINRHGRTEFVEDDPDWADTVRAQRPGRVVHKVAYTTRLGDCGTYRTPEEVPVPELPAEITATAWDVVVVDGPQGWGPDVAGRYPTVVLASRLVAPGGMVLVDDYNRPGEQGACQLAFGRPPDVVLDPTQIGRAHV